jgi:hypothetical protein
VKLIAVLPIQAIRQRRIAALIYGGCCSVPLRGQDVGKRWATVGAALIETLAVR